MKDISKRTLENHQKNIFSLMNSLNQNQNQKLKLR